MEELRTSDAPSRLASLEQDYNRMKRRLRLLQFIGTVTLIVISVTAMAGALFRESKVIEADQFIIRDDRGTIRISLSITEDGEPLLEFLDARQNVRMSLGETKNGTPGIAIYDESYTKRSGYGMMDDGTAALGFLNKDGDYRMGLGVRANGYASLDFRDESGLTWGEIGISQDNHPIHKLYDNKHNELISHPE